MLLLQVGGGCAARQGVDVSDQAATCTKDWRLTCMICNEREDIILVPQMVGENDKLIGYLAVCVGCRSMFDGADITPRLIVKEHSI